jgi:hypothetical protein
MANVESSVLISRPVEEVFRFYLDFERNVRTIEPSVQAIVKATDGPTGSGTTFRLQRNVFGKVWEMTLTLVSVELNRRIEVQPRIFGRVASNTTITFDRANGGTRVVAQCNINPVGALSLLTPVIARIDRKAWDQRLARLKAAVES